MIHKWIISEFKDDPEFQKSTTNKLNNIFQWSGGLSSEFLIQKTNEMLDETNSCIYKIILGTTSRTNKSNHKNMIDQIVRVLYYIIAKHNLKKSSMKHI